TCADNRMRSGQALPRLDELVADTPRAKTVAPRSTSRRRTWYRGPMMLEVTHWSRPQQGARSRRRLLQGAALAGTNLARWALAGCAGGEDTNQAKRGATGAAEAGGAPAVEGQPVAGGTFILLQTRDAASLDPLASQVYTTPERIGLVYPRLIYYDRDAKADAA